MFFIYVFYLYAFFYVLHFCRIFATALYPYLCFLLRFAFLSHICDSPNYL